MSKAKYLQPLADWKSHGGLSARVDQTRDFIESYANGSQFNDFGRPCCNSTPS
jgi:hypothetical protein